VVLAVAHPWASASSYLSLVAVSRQFSQRPSCHLAVVPLSSFSLLLIHPLTPSLSSAASTLVLRRRHRPPRLSSVGPGARLAG